MMGFTSVAAVLIGGASPNRAKISHVLIGTFLFQGILALGLPVANQFIPESNLSEVMRLIISKPGRWCFSCPVRRWGRSARRS